MAYLVQPITIICVGDLCIPDDISDDICVSPRALSATPPPPTPLRPFTSQPKRLSVWEDTGRLMQLIIMD